MKIFIPLALGLFAIHSHAVLHEAKDRKDFDIRPYKNKERYEEYEKSGDPLTFQEDQMCPCGKELVNAMILVYFDQFGPNGTVDIRLPPRRFLVSQQHMGYGAFARVYHGTPLSDRNVLGDCVAIKRPTSIQYPNDYEHGIKELKKEAELLAEFSDAKHVIKLKEMLLFENYAYEDKPALIMELGVQTVQQFCVTALDYPHPHVHEGKILWILKQMLLGLMEVHEKDYIYLDMKPQNMLVMPYPKISDGSGQRQIDEVYLKLIDMAGIKKIPHGKNYVEASVHTTILTNRFEAPETYTAADRNSMKITKAYDIWSFGICIIELLSNTKVYKEHLNTKEKRQQIYQELQLMNIPVEKENREKLKDGIPPLENMDEDLEKFLQKMVLTTLARDVIAKCLGQKFPFMHKIVVDLKNHFRDTMRIVRMCLKMNPNKRPSAKDLLESTIFKTMNMDRIYDQVKAEHAGSSAFSESSSSAAAAAAAAAAAGASSPHRSTSPRLVRKPGKHYADDMFYKKDQHGEEEVLRSP